MTSAQKPVVLVVDDEESNREVCQHALELNGYDVVVAGGAREAVQAISARAIDFVICDVSMPHNGQRVYQYLLAHFPRLRGRFLFVTGNPLRKDEIEQQAEAAPCLMKPYSISLLLDTLKTALGA